MLSSRTSAIAILLAVVAGCATPPEIKEALRAKDHAYSDNAQLMDQYRQLLQNVDTRFEYWQRLIETRLKLSLALKWATTDPGAKDPPAKQQILAEEVAKQLGPEVVKVVNTVRLVALPARSGTTNQELFRKGSGTMSSVIQALPALTATIDDSVAADYHKTVPALDVSAYEDYRTNIAALRRLNGTVQQYMNIDVTASNHDVKELAETLRTIRR